MMSTNFYSPPPQVDVKGGLYSQRAMQLVDRRHEIKIDPKLLLDMLRLVGAQTLPHVLFYKLIP